MAESDGPRIGAGAGGLLRGESYESRVLLVLDQEAAQAQIFTLFVWLESLKPLGGWLRRRRLEIRRRLVGTSIAARLTAGPEEISSVVESAVMPLHALLRPQRPGGLEDLVRYVARELDWFLDMPHSPIRRQWILTALWSAAVAWALMLFLFIVTGATRPGLGWLVGLSALLIGYLIALDYQRWRTAMHANELAAQVRRLSAPRRRMNETELMAQYRRRHGQPDERLIEPFRETTGGAALEIEPQAGTEEL